MRSPRLRTRVMATFAAGALAISTTITILSYDLTRATLLGNRERSAERTAYFDASVVQAGLTGDEPDVIAVLRALDTGGSRHALIFRDGRWYARSADTGITASIPAALQKMVADGQPGVQRVRVQTRGVVALAIGIPLDGGDQFYIVDSLHELQQTLDTMGIVLALVAAATTAAGAAIGAYGSGRVVRPLERVAAAARDISAGNLAARLDPATEPDLEPLSTSFNHMVDQLAARIERDRRFAADVSHELRSPLQTLAAAVTVLNRRRDKLDERSALAVSLIVEEVDRFQDLVTDLLELARSDQPVERVPIDVGEAARQACRAWRVAPQVVDAPAGTVWSVDRRRFDQILANLLDNAVRHGGGVTSVRLSTEDGLGCLEVDDEGPGVAPADRETIFNRFMRGPEANARGSSDGAGLGLALVSEHAAAHGGRVTVSDRPGGGARFRVELPKVDA